MKTTIEQRILAPMAASALTTLVMMLSLPNAATADDLQVIRDRDYIRGVVANEEPYGYINSAGKAAGIGPDVATSVLKKLGIEKIEWTVVAFDGLIPGVKANRFDFAAAEQKITKPRCGQVTFTQPNSSYGAGILVAAGNPKNIKGYEDLAAPGVKLAALAGVAEDLWDAYHIPDSNKVFIQNNADAVSTIIAGRADAYDSTELTVAVLDKMHDEVEAVKLAKDPVVNGKPFRSYGAFTFRPQDKELYRAFNDALVEFKKTPEYAKILTSYGLTEASVEAARKASTEQLCQEE